ncbi:MAG TPA: protein-export chaperone SecB [Alphaproteobacteria bacterium]
MADEQIAGTPPSALPLAIQAQYLKDLSFENPQAPSHYSKMQEAAGSGPNVSIEVSTNARGLGGDNYEVALTMRGEAKIEAQTLFLVEVSYAGIFTVQGVAEPDRMALLLIEGARHLFPFARNIVADATRDGGFPPLMIHPIDFAELYRRRRAEGNLPGLQAGSPQGTA